ncbi:hypothetical protein HPB49_013829 [Dermacentor silvarum]|uniref:Uncharacterized protein n=1 Tax=Dermacentor silvarum TaxID=543639 RepID=A0ACB8DPB8_DERSI|nr:hypothetical protein HPB49_013829 [Dermacentor silvarum]
MLWMYNRNKVLTEWNGSWWKARVLTVDSILVEVLCKADNHTKWIYRGSTRFAPLNLEVQNTAAAGGCMPRHNLVPVTDEQHVEDEPAKGSDGINSREDSAKVSACKSTTHDHKVGEEDDATECTWYATLRLAPESCI